MKIFLKVLFILACILLAVCLIRVLYGGSPPTFTTLLNMLQSSPDVNFNWNLGISNADWGWFEFLRKFLDVILSAVMFILEGVITVFRYVFYFVKWIFI